MKSNNPKKKRKQLKSTTVSWKEAILTLKPTSNNTNIQIRKFQFR